MFGIVDPKDGNIRIFRIVIFDALVLFLLSVLIVLGVVASSPLRQFATPRYLRSTPLSSGKYTGVAVHRPEPPVL
jgi:hypothetical protein